jgi:hypothetical protein
MSNDYPHIKKEDGMKQVQRVGVAFLVAFLLMAYGCGPKPANTGYSDTVPDELQHLIKQFYNDGIYAVGTAIGPNESVASNKATLSARSEIAKQFKAQIDVLQKEYDEEINDKTSGEYSQVTEIFAQLDIGGSKVVKTLVHQDAGKDYSAKVLVVVSAEQVKNLFEQKLGSYESFKASKAYKELEERAARERKNQEHMSE